MSQVPSKSRASVLFAARKLFSLFASYTILPSKSGQSAAAGLQIAQTAEGYIPLPHASAARTHAVSYGMKAGSMHGLLAFKKVRQSPNSCVLIYAFSQGDLTQSNLLVPNSGSFDSTSMQLRTDDFWHINEVKGIWSGALVRLVEELVLNDPV